METLDVKIYSNAKIEELANEILSHTGNNDTVGIDIAKLAQILGLNVYSTILTDSSGYIKYENNEKNIYINQLDSIKRQRFTIAHEIGHYLLHRNLIEREGGSILYRSENIDIIEQQANRCAAALLMPQRLVRQYFDNIQGSIATKIVTLANLFKVSVDAMYVRLSILNLIE